MRKMKSMEEEEEYGRGTGEQEVIDGSNLMESKRKMKHNPKSDRG